MSLGVVKRDAIGKGVKLDEPAAKFSFKLPVSAAVGEDTLKVSLNYYCEESAEGVCKTGVVTWTIPLKLAESASAATLELQHKVE